MRELELIEAIGRLLGSRGGRVLVGPGDDAAVVRARPLAVTSIDTVCEGVHFRSSTHSPADVGHKALASALSDLAAMGAEPGEAYVSLALPPEVAGESALELVAAMEALAARTGTTIAGGDVVSGPALVVTVAVTGWAQERSELAGRDGARPGDLVGVTGELGGAAAGLLLLDRVAAELPEDASAALVRRQRRPEPLLEAGRALVAAGAGAMLDLSDGLAGDARRLARSSGVGLRIELARLPLQAGVAEVARAAGRSAWELGAAGGEDYELLLTAPAAARERVEAAARAAGTRVTWLGAAVAGADVGGADVALLDASGTPVALAGYEHG